jgi:hypothetical protein
MSNFRAVDRGTAYLLPPSVDEWLPADHLARFVVEIIEQLDFSGLVHHMKINGTSGLNRRDLLKVTGMAAALSLLPITSRVVNAAGSEGRSRGAGGEYQRPAGGPAGLAGLRV